MSTITRLEFLRTTTAMSAASLVGASAAAAQRIDERGYVRIGGIDQWIAIQGEDTRDPALLYLHGGPAEVQSPFLREFVPWERDFTVVNWDQRGAGKTYERNGAATPDVTVERIALDAIEVAQHACTRLGKDKMILVGQSWGCVVGVYAVLRRPDIFAAYVGTGQPVNWDLSLQAREQYAREQMLAHRDTAALTKLHQVQSLPTTDFKRLSVTFNRRWAPSDLTYLSRTEGLFLPSSLDKAKGDAAAFIAGSDFSGRKLWKTSTTFDARTMTAFAVPMFVIQGREDHIVSNAAAKAWIDSLHAPAKAFVLIDGGHFACFTYPNEFNAAVRSNTKPWAS